MAVRADTLDRFARDWRELTGVRCGERTLVAVSGGADSMALLLLLHAFLGGQCRAATVDHGLRPESADETASVARFCASRGIAHQILTGEMPARVAGSANLSARARVLRYDLLHAYAREAEAGWIATAHHADDQLETMIMRLNRSSGVAGLAGIRRWEHGHSHAVVVRPVLGWRHAQLAALVLAEGITPVEDPSNADDRYDRARLRKLLAGVEWLDPSAVARSAAALGEAEEALQWIVERERRDSCLFDPGRAVLRFTEGPRALVRRLVEICLRHVDPTIAPRGREIDRLLGALESGAPATLGRVRCGHAMHRAHDLSQLSWTFEAAPPRRAP